MRTYPLDEIIDASADPDSIRSDGYSGRGMYGKTCAAITFKSLPESFRFFASLGSFATSYDDAAMDPSHPASKAMYELVNAARTDSMGTDIVAYFPGWTFA